METNEAEKAILYRLDDAREMLVPLVNDHALRKWLLGVEVRQVKGVLTKIVELRRDMVERFTR